MFARRTAVVLGAGIGEMTLALQTAGYMVLEAYESDERAVAIHRANLDIPVHAASLFEIDSRHLYEADLLAVRLTLGSSESGRRLAKIADEGLRWIEILNEAKPRAFLLYVNSAFARSREFAAFLTQLDGRGQYHISWRTMDVGRLTDFPVRENMTLVVGVRQDSGISFSFPECEVVLTNSKMDDLIGAEHPQDPWYTALRPDECASVEGDGRYYSWHSKSQCYRASAQVNWNIYKLPLIKDWNGNLRRITPREVALLKGFPAQYQLDTANRAWLYRRLIYSGNVIVLSYVAQQLVAQHAEASVWRQRDREGYLSGLLDRFLHEASAVEEIRFLSAADTKQRRADFVLQRADGSCFLIEVKCFGGMDVPSAPLERICVELAQQHEFGQSVLITPNCVSEQLKQDYLEKYRVAIWDVCNLLWLFRNSPEIRDAFIASLDYAVDKFAPEPPALNLFAPVLEASGHSENANRREILEKLPTGRLYAAEYERCCTDLLKYIFGDYLTLWKQQQSSSNGLYRFDLYCKIKEGVTQDFFDTVKHYFNTKYIVFEFKNYSDKITQAEIYTTEKYLYEKALRKVAIVISRKGIDDHALCAIKGVLRENGKLIIPLCDADLFRLIDIKEKGEQETASYLSDILDDLFLNLEK